MIWNSSSASWGVDLGVAQLIKQEKVRAAVAAGQAGQLPLVGGLDQLVDQLGGGDVTDPAAPLAGRQAEPDQQVSLPVPLSPSSANGSPVSPRPPSEQAVAVTVVMERSWSAARHSRSGWGRGGRSGRAHRSGVTAAQGPPR